MNLEDFNYTTQHKTADKLHKNSYIIDTKAKLNAQII